MNTYALFMVAVRWNVVSFPLVELVFVRVMLRTTENSVALMVLLNRNVAPNMVPLLGTNVRLTLSSVSATTPENFSVQYSLKTKQKLVSSVGANCTENVSSRTGLNAVIETVERTGPAGLNPLHSTFLMGVKNVLIRVFGSMRMLVRNVSALSDTRVRPATMHLNLTLMTGRTRHVSRRSRMIWLCSYFR